MDGSSSSTSSFNLPNFNYNFTLGNQTYSTNTSTSEEPLIFIKTSLWELSAGSVMIIPLNSLFIASGLRLLFCKVRIEVMKYSLLVILLLLYVSSMIGLSLYSTQSNLDLFKQNFFLQYIILTISLVLGFLTEAIALLMMAYYFMKVMQS